MFTVRNEQLGELIQNSTVLKSKLTEKQLVIFLQRAMNLPPEGQEELLALLRSEEAEIETNRVVAEKKALEDLHSYNHRVNKGLRDFERETYKIAETEVETDEQSIEATLLQNLDNPNNPA